MIDDVIVLVETVDNDDKALGPLVALEDGVVAPEDADGKHGLLEEEHAIVAVLHHIRCPLQFPCEIAKHRIHTHAKPLGLAGEAPDRHINQSSRSEFACNLHCADVYPFGRHCRWNEVGNSCGTTFAPSVAPTQQPIRSPTPGSGANKLTHWTGSAVLVVLVAYLI